MANNIKNTGTDYGQLMVNAKKNSDGWINDAVKERTTFNLFGLHVPRTPLFTDETKLQAELQRLRDLQQQVYQALQKAASVGEQISSKMDGTSQG